MNRIILIGNLGQDPKVETKNGITYARLSVCVNEFWKDQDGNKKERSDWFNVVGFGNLAISLSHLRKGAKVGIEGKLRANVYEKDGQKRTSVEVHADRVEFLTPKRKPADAAETENGDSETSEAAMPESEVGDPDDDDGVDIPF